jgi:hypothetical protein
MKAFISGMVVSVYNRVGRDKDGKSISIPMADLYCGHEIVKVAKVDESFVQGSLMEYIPVNVYSNQYGLSVVFDNQV